MNEEIEWVQFTYKCGHGGKLGFAPDTGATKEGILKALADEESRRCHACSYEQDLENFRQIIEEVRNSRR